MKRIYTLLYKFFRSRAVEIQRKESAQVKCPNCNKWTHEMLVDGEGYNVEYTDFGFVLDCGNCHNVSYWNCAIAPVALRCDKDGTPL